RPEHLILRVDRTDLSKNIVRGFLAYERMLQAHPELHGKVLFWAYLQPSRQDIDDYRAYLGSVLSVAARVNRAYSRGGWTPIRVEIEDNMDRAIAGYRNFDVLLVNPIYDGITWSPRRARCATGATGLWCSARMRGHTRSWVTTCSPSIRSTSMRR